MHIVKVGDSYVVQLNDTPTEQQKLAIEKTGAIIESYLPDRAFIVRSFDVPSEVRELRKQLRELQSAQQKLKEAVEKLKGKQKSSETNSSEKAADEQDSKENGSDEPSNDEKDDDELTSD